MQHDSLSAHNPPQDQTSDPLIMSTASDQGLPNRPQLKAVQIYCVSSLGYNIHSSKGPELFVRVHKWNFRKPNLVIYLWDRELNRELAHCKFKETTGQCDLGFSTGPRGETSMLWWSNTNRTIHISTEYRFSAKVNPSKYEKDNLADVHLYKTFVWKRTSRFELVDEATGSVAALVHETTLERSKLGSLEVLASLGPSFIIIALGTFLTVCERIKDDKKFKLK